LFWPYGLTYGCNNGKTTISGLIKS
jgi:hypothetical protein